MKKTFLSSTILLTLNAPILAENNEPIKFSGVIELEAAHTDDEDTFDLGTFELGIEAHLKNNVRAEGVLAMDDDGKIEVDTATITFGNPEGGFARAGLMTVPFGNYDTHMISDPLTIFGETGNTTVQLGTTTGNLSGSLFALKRDDETTFGVNAAIGQEDKYSVGVSYINQLNSADGFEEVDTHGEKIGGISAYGSTTLGAITLSAEYLSASKKFKTGDLANEKPSAFNVETAYNFTLSGKELTAAIGHQKSKQASALDIPESRQIAALSIPLRESTNLAFEYAKDKGYDGETDKTITALLAVEF